MNEETNVDLFSQEDKEEIKAIHKIGDSLIDIMNRTDKVNAAYLYGYLNQFCKVLKDKFNIDG